MNLRSPRLAFLATFVLAIAANESSAGLTTFTQWDFNTTSSLNNSPTANVNLTGTAVATVLGMNNGYTFSSNNTITGSGTFIPGTIDGTVSTAAADITATAGAPSGDANAWRIRGPSNNVNGVGGLGNGWALQAPQYTQGAQFSSSTAGYSNISFHFDWYTTTQGVKNMQEQYTLDGTDWININAPLTAVSNGWLPTQTINFSGVSGVANDPNFGVRLVSCYDTTLAIPNYGSADGGQNGYYNNNSGNWRFTNVGFSGTPNAIPEPSSILLVSIATSTILVAARRRRPKA